MCKNCTAINVDVNTSELSRENLYNFVEAFTKPLMDEIKKLREEVFILKESNIQLLHLYTPKSVTKDKITHQVRNVNTSNSPHIITSVPLADDIAAPLTSTSLKDNSTIVNLGVSDKINNKNLSKKDTKTMKTHKECSEIIKPNDQLEMNKLNETPFTLVTHRKNIKQREQPTQRRKSLLIGSGNTTSTTLKSVPKMAYFHVSRLEPSTTEESIVELLRKYVSQVQCEKLNSKMPNIYASFKITIPLNEKDKIINPELWPNGITVNRFFFRAPPTQHET